VFYSVAEDKHKTKREKAVNPQLRILKGKHTKDNVPKRLIRFAIIDQDSPKRYPANFVCILPQHMNGATTEASVFAKTFRENHVGVAKELLTNALQQEHDPHVKKEIEARLRQLEPKYEWHKF
jgi:hypothetical protein